MRSSLLFLLPFAVSIFCLLLVSLPAEAALVCVYFRDVKLDMTMLEVPSPCSRYYPTCPSFHLRCVRRASSKSPTITRDFTEMENVRISDFHGFPLSHLLLLFDFLRGSRHSFLFPFFSGVCLCLNYSAACVLFFYLHFLFFPFSMSLSRQRIVSHCC